MRYFVIWSDGRRFGPTDEDGLERWLHDGRINSATILEEEETGSTRVVGDIEWLRHRSLDGSEPPFSKAVSPPEVIGPFAGPEPPLADNGATDISCAWFLTLLGIGLSLMLFLFFGLNCLVVILPFFGLRYANAGLAKGHPSGRITRASVLVLMLVVLAIGIYSIGVSYLKWPIPLGTGR
jgi:hypothetical protein